VPRYGGDPAGGETLRITDTTADTTTGIGLPSTVNFGTATTTAITPVPGSSDQIDVITPAGLPGSTVDVTITTPDGDASPAVPAGSFTYATPNQPVTPGQPFRLIWSCYDGSGPHLSWSADVNATVTVTPETATSPVNSSDPLPTTSGSAIATITTESASAAVTNTATFDLGQDQPIGGPTGSIIVTVNPLTVISDFSPGQPVTNPDGTQNVTFRWQILNATGFIISGGGLTGTALPGNASSYEVTLPMPLAVTSYTLTASGFGKAAPPYAKTVQVTPNAVAITDFSVSGPYVGPDEQQSVTVSWQAANATGFNVIADAGSITLGAQATSASVPLPPPTSPPQPAQYPVTVTAQGYQSQFRVKQVTPVQVGGLAATAIPTSIVAGDSVTLSWSATAATGFELAGNHYPASTRQLTVRPQNTTTFTLIAEGYTTGTQFPSYGLTVEVSEKQVVVPNVTRQSLTDATTTLRSAGLTWTVVQTETGGERPTVIAQTPPAGTLVAYGALIGLTVLQPRNGPPL
jgi:PASTA domain